MTKSRWIIFAVICLSVLGLIIFTNKSSKSNSAFNGDAAKVITEGSIADHTIGSNEQKIVLTEYADYQCPGCATAYPMIKEVADKYKDHLTFIFRNMPLTTIHPNALAAATAAEAAGMQNKYFEYHDLLYQNQSSWESLAVNERTSMFEAYAKQLGLDISKFRTDLGSSQITDKINRDRSTAGKFSISSTPTLVLNGEKIDQNIAFDKDKLSQRIEEEYKKFNLDLPQ